MFPYNLQAHLKFIKILKNIGFLSDISISSIDSNVIINWGYKETETNQISVGALINLPLAYTNATHSVTQGCYTTNSSANVNLYDFGILDRTNTTFKMRLEANKWITGYNWISIGY